MPASSASSLSSRSQPSCSGIQRNSSHRDPKLLLGAESDFDETESVASSASSRTSVSTFSYSSRCSHRSKSTAAVSASIATSCVSLRVLESRKNQIERELARVQHELQLRESQQAVARLSSSFGPPENDKK
ncbi:uncharacterized protein IUM83_15705 [Phytophthora cinnamomi]|uniref:uncharacterized protein n=1 Tax=Phytophthora cinnamomi TaxID=4785 RepID=UPI003559B912|nr:hypothetical protein IUM83_15705 [Phytophthora cinnamomi]